jgi:hypothetical protein
VKGGDGEVATGEDAPGLIDCNGSTAARYDDGFTVDAAEEVALIALSEFPFEWLSTEVALMDGLEVVGAGEELEI